MPWPSVWCSQGDAIDTGNVNTVATPSSSFSLHLLPLFEDILAVAFAQSEYTSFRRLQRAALFNEDVLSPTHFPYNAPQLLRTAACRDCGDQWRPRNSPRSYESSRNPAYQGRGSTQLAATAQMRFSVRRGSLHRRNRRSWRTRCFGCSQQNLLKVSIEFMTGNDG
jgi:hypothetical protein